MFTINQTATGWEVLGPDGARIGEVLATYALALDVIAQQLAALQEWAAALAVDNPTEATGATDDGLLPERWVSPTTTLSEPTGDGRDFTECAWTWRDPAVSLLPLMLQTCTDMGHFGAELAGFIETIGAGSEGTGGTNSAGRFYDSEQGRALRDMLLGGRRFGVSADPGPGTEAEFHCTEFEDDGWCLDGDMVFTAYEVIGLTATPFPGFATAYIQLEGTPAAAPDIPVEGGDAGPAASVQAAGGRQQRTRGAVGVLERPATATMAIPARPPRAWFEIPEPEPGQTGMLDVYGMPVEELLVEQDDGRLGVPLTILNDGRWFGHAALWGSCHVGRLDMCVQPPESLTAYRHFHIGATTLADGRTIPTGNLVVGMDHPDLALAWSLAQDAYAHDGRTWGTGRATNGTLGCWMSGCLRPDQTEAQVDLLRQLALSGDWRSIDGSPLEMIGTLAVPIPGFPISREAIAASGDVIGGPARFATRLSGMDQTPTALVAAGQVHRCPECAKRAALARRQQSDEGLLRTVVAELRSTRVSLDTLERRTRHLVPDAVAAAAKQLRP